MQKKCSDEIRLILSCSRPESDAGLYSLVRHSLDWEFILGQAAYHNIIPLLYHKLSKIDKSKFVSPRIFSRLKQGYEISLTWNLLLAEELHSVLTALNKAGIDAIPIKGVILAEILYSNIALRGTGDIDILIDKGNIPAADDALFRLGYHKALAGYSESYYKKYHCHMPYERTDESGRRFLCEIHWALSFPRPNIISLPDIWKAARRRTIKDRSMLCLSCEDTFFSLALHLRRYSVPLSLRYICDISRLIKLYEHSIDWDYIIAESRNNRAVSTSYFALYSAKEMLDTPITDDVLDSLNPGFIRRRYLRYLIRNKTFSVSLQDEQSRKYFYVFLRFLLYDRTRDFLSYLVAIPAEEFARFYALPLDSRKTSVLYRVRILYILFMSFLEISSILRRHRLR